MAAVARGSDLNDAEMVPSALKVSKLYSFEEVIQRVADFPGHADTTKNTLMK